MSQSLQLVHENDKEILLNLYSLYLHDLSKYTNSIDLGPDGVFHFDGSDLFWETEGITPYFIKYENSIVGFLLLIERPFLKNESDYGINDIFILNKFRGKGLGKKVLEILFKEKHGEYFVIELVENVPAVSFWKKVYRQFNIEFVEREELIDDEPCLIQTFSI
ncbi:GNAT family N-acetyltransferase [Bacillus sp. JJ722]|uniref:GNAT family N-acetyltransferase n=1 Tax=Bacillus sp. JJ722 TaxID=3122973 RepID=UPI003000C718